MEDLCRGKAEITSSIQADAHLSACVIFLAPIVYINEPLTVYRVHRGNSWNWAGNIPPGRNTSREIRLPGRGCNEA